MCYTVLFLFQSFHLSQSVSLCLSDSVSFFLIEFMQIKLHHRPTLILWKSWRPRLEAGPGLHTSIPNLGMYVYLSL